MGFNLFGLEIKFAKKDNPGNPGGCYVTKADCHYAMDAVGDRIGELFTHIDKRMDDLKDFILNGKK